MRNVYTNFKINKATEITTNLYFESVNESVYPLKVILEFIFKDSLSGNERKALITLIYDTPKQTQFLFELAKNRKMGICAVSDNKVLITNASKVVLGEYSTIQGLLKVTEDKLSYTFLDDDETFIIYDNKEEIDTVMESILGRFETSYIEYVVKNNVSKEEQDDLKNYISIPALSEAVHNA